MTGTYPRTIEDGVRSARRLRGDVGAGRLEVAAAR